MKRPSELKPTIAVYLTLALRDACQMKQCFYDPKLHAKSQLLLKRQPPREEALSGRRIDQHPPKEACKCPTSPSLRLLTRVKSSHISIWSTRHRLPWCPFWIPRATMAKCARRVQVKILWAAANCLS